MSWSKSASGAASDVKDQINRWADEQKATDEGYSLSAPAVEGHQAQIERATDTIADFCDASPDGAVFTISASGHHSGSPSSDQQSLSVSYYVPARADA